MDVVVTLTHLCKSNNKLYRNTQIHNLRQRSSALFTSGRTLALISHPLFQNMLTLIATLLRIKGVPKLTKLQICCLFVFY